MDSRYKSVWKRFDTRVEQLLSRERMPEKVAFLVVGAYWLRFVAWKTMADLHLLDSVLLAPGTSSPSQDTIDRYTAIPLGALETAIAIGAYMLLRTLIEQIQALKVKGIEARILDLREPLRTIAHNQFIRLTGNIKRMESRALTLPVIAPSEDIRRDFEAIMDNAHSYLDAVTIPRFWDYDIMGGRHALRSYVAANLACAQRGVTIRRYLVTADGDPEKLSGGVREAVVRLLEAERGIGRHSKGKLELYLIPRDQAPDGYGLDNFGFWDDHDGSQWYVNMYYKQRLPVDHASPQRFDFSHVEIGPYSGERLDDEAHARELRGRVEVLKQLGTDHPEYRLDTKTVLMRRLPDTSNRHIFRHRLPASLLVGADRFDVLLKDCHDSAHGILGLGLILGNKVPQLDRGTRVQLDDGSGNEVQVPHRPNLSREYEVRWCGPREDKSGRPFEGLGLSSVSTQP